MREGGREGREEKRREGGGGVERGRRGKERK